MNSVLAGVIATVSTGLNLVLEGADSRQVNPPELLSLVEEAREEWAAARTYFDSVSEPDLIDHAVYVSQAAEKRYMYLLKQARSQGLQASSLLYRPQA